MDFKNLTVKELRALKLDINAVIKTKLETEKTETAETKESAKAEARAKGAAFIATKPINSIVNVIVGDETVALELKKINNEKFTISGHRLDENGEKLLNADGKPITLWRYFEAIVTE